MHCTHTYTSNYCMHHVQMHKQVFEYLYIAVNHRLQFCWPKCFVLILQFGCADLWFADVGPMRQNLQRCEYNHLKSMNITWYKGARCQLEFILHVVENAPALEVLTVYTTRDMDEHAGQVAKCCLSQKHFPTLKFCVVSVIYCCKKHSASRGAI